MKTPRSSRFWFQVFLLATLLTLISLRLWRRYWDSSLIITFFDVGQGDAALVQFPFGKTLLVDAGGGYRDWNVGSKIVFPELARLGILEVNYSLMSHPDNDHAKGFTGLFQDLRINEFWINAAFLFSKHPLLQQLEAQAKGRAIQEKAFSSETQLMINGAKLTLYPVNENESGSETNNRTLVALLEFKGCKILFTGDIEEGAEHRLVSSDLGQVDLLKVPHHGSKTSSTIPFLKKLNPRWAIVSVGMRNRYGHPKKEVIERYLSLGTQILRTDFHGAIRFRISENGEITCSTVKGECGRSSCLGY